MYERLRFGVRALNGTTFLHQAYLLLNVIGLECGAKRTVSQIAHQDHRQGNRALSQVTADGLTKLLLGSREVENVVDDLEGQSQVLAVHPQRVYLQSIQANQQASPLTRQHKK